MKKPVFAANWKMHKGPTETRAFFTAFLSLHPAGAAGTVIFFPPAVSLAAARQSAEQRPELRFGVQHVHWEQSGAYTGEISPQIASDAGAEFALVGHSERRHGFGETNEETARKVRAALDVPLTPVLCVGETLAERRARRQQAVVEDQLARALDPLPPADTLRILIAYEPVWAIGTGETASPADAAAMHGAIRASLRRRVGPDAAAVPILYGGSVKPDNVGELLAAGDVDGVLVGGASLDAASFAAICKVSD